MIKMRIIFGLVLGSLFLSGIFISCSNVTSDPEEEDEKIYRSTFTGKVVDKNDNGLSGVSVTSDPAGHTTVTNSDGEFSLPDIEAGIYTFDFHLVDYLDATSKEYELGLADEVSLDEDMKMTFRYATISGTVTESDGSTALIGAGVVVEKQSVFGMSFSGGEFLLERVEPGDIKLLSALAGSGTGLESISVSADEEKTGVKLVHDSDGGTVSGQLFKEEGGQEFSGKKRSARAPDPLVNASVSALGGAIETTTDSLGFFTLMGVPNGGVVVLSVVDELGDTLRLGGVEVNEHQSIDLEEVTVQTAVVEGSITMIPFSIKTNTDESTVTLIVDASTSDRDASIDFYEWDTDNDGSFDVITQTPTLEHTTSGTAGTTYVRVRATATDSTTSGIVYLRIEVEEVDEVVQTTTDGIFKGALSYSGSLFTVSGSIPLYAGVFDLADVEFQNPVALDTLTGATGTYSLQVPPGDYKLGFFVDGNNNGDREGDEPSGGPDSTFTVIADTTITFHFSFADDNVGVDIVRPSVLAGLTANVISSTQIDLSWTASGDADAETIRINYRTDGIDPTDEDDGTNFQDVEGTSTRISVTGLMPETPYHFALFVKDSTGNWSDAATVNDTTSAGVTINPGELSITPGTYAAEVIWIDSVDGNTSVLDTHIVNSNGTVKLLTAMKQPGATDFCAHFRGQSSFTIGTDSMRTANDLVLQVGNYCTNEYGFFHSFEDDVVKIVAATDSSFTITGNYMSDMDGNSQVVYTKIKDDTDESDWIFADESKAYIVVNANYTGSLVSDWDDGDAEFKVFALDTSDTDLNYGVNLSAGSAAVYLALEPEPSYIVAALVDLNGDGVPDGGEPNVLYGAGDEAVKFQDAVVADGKVFNLKAGEQQTITLEFDDSFARTGETIIPGIKDIEYREEFSEDFSGQTSLPQEFSSLIFPAGFIEVMNEEIVCSTDGQQMFSAIFHQPHDEDDLGASINFQYIQGTAASNTGLALTLKADTITHGGPANQNSYSAGVSFGPGEAGFSINRTDNNVVTTLASTTEITIEENKRYNLQIFMDDDRLMAVLADTSGVQADTLHATDPNEVLPAGIISINGNQIHNTTVFVDDFKVFLPVEK